MHEPALSQLGDRKIQAIRRGGRGWFPPADPCMESRWVWMKFRFDCGRWQMQIIYHVPTPDCALSRHMRRGSAS
jgi:hypothetical protein